ncbi:uncharacterized protein PpBr36_10119 [Pyricularia pennisetigena]|uniref:uncharacterized protein n=1 Tax=Pyricularia pennisetigena TaxID=1578925 RepID=UPI00114E3322|nr:uncharacterized protein PpBr36_10119 [Pyricularia pennisetigena]TLS21599.1 hypothetical protein PpBr36_10119 [Pyricularia pennisetigena]
MVGPSVVHLPDGQTFTVTPVFAGFFFKSHELTHEHAFPVGWTVVLHTQENLSASASASASAPATPAAGKKENDQEDNGDDDMQPIRPYTGPTLQGDCLFISSISNPSSSEFAPPVSPTRQIAMMLWVTLYWYFHEPAPSPILPATTSSASTPEAGRPRGDWRINIKRSGVLREKNLLPKLERMGLITTLASSAGPAEGDAEWDDMFVTRNTFWQIPARLFLFTLAPKPRGSNADEARVGTPSGSRPTSSTAATSPASPSVRPQPLPPASSFPMGPFHSSAHLPTYYPPAPAQYTMTNGVRHPMRPRPPRQGEVFYSRYVPSAGAYLSLRVASLQPDPVPYGGPVGPGQGSSRISAGAASHAHLASLADTSLLQMWMAKERVSAFWGSYTPTFLSAVLESKHSFPVVALWDGIPFAYLEIYWLREDPIARCLGPGSAGDWDRGLHVFVGEEWARGMVQLWLSSAVHWILTADYRTMSVCMEPRVDNVRFIQHLQAGGFEKETELSLPHKQAWFGRLRRENWEGPSL